MTQGFDLTSLVVVMSIIIAIVLALLYIPYVTVIKIVL